MWLGAWVPPPSSPPAARASALRSHTFWHCPVAQTVVSQLNLGLITSNVRVCDMHVWLQAPLPPHFFTLTYGLYLHGGLACYGSRPLPPLVSRRNIIHGSAPQRGTYASIPPCLLHILDAPSRLCYSPHPTPYMGLSRAQPPFPLLPLPPLPTPILRLNLPPAARIQITYT